MVNQSAGQQTTLVTNKQNLKSLLNKDVVGETLARVSTRWMSADQLRTQAVLAVARNPALLRCTQTSFLEAMVRAAELGLRFAGAGGEAYLIPFKSQCTLIVGYRGLLALARRTGKVTRIEARCVHEKDVFKVDFGSGQKLTHRPCLEADRGDITCAYALAQLRDGSIQLETMTRTEIDGIRKRSPAANDGPWKTDFSAMCRKTVLRRLCKYLPFPTVYDDALAAEEPVKSEEQPRKQVETSEVSANVDIETGEVIDVGQTGVGQPETVSADEGQAAGSEQSQAGEAATDLDNKKSRLIDKVVTELGKLHPGDSIESQAARLKTLDYIFGKVVLDEIIRLPLEILEAGLGAMKSKAAAAAAETKDDIPF
ncbi:hypothetical protein ES703_28938 [subsurface metagenome]